MSEDDNNIDIHLEELFNFCDSESSLTEDGLREIIERHGLKPCNLEGDYDFFLLACGNERVNEGIIRYLLEHFPDAVNATDDDGLTPLHCTCCNKSNVTLNVIQHLIEVAPDSVRSEDNDGWLPLHYLCMRKADEAAGTQTLNLLIEKYPEAVRHVTNNGFLPIHKACLGRSPDFCSVLLEAYPGSERIPTTNGALPLHCACARNSFATVEYFFRLYPVAIDHATIGGVYPIHGAINNMTARDDPMTAARIVQFLLGCDPNQRLIQVEGMSLLQYACVQQYNDSNVEAAIEMIKIIYDAHPEAIEDNMIAANIHDYHQQVQEFINDELVYARQAKNLRLMMTPDNNGRLPLHKALQNNIRLGSIKLLAKGNSSAIRNFDDNGVIPLHVACQYHDSACVVGYLIELADVTLDTIDRQGNTALHYACRGAKYQTIALLLESFDAVSVSKRNAQNELPIELLWESDQVDRESVEYTDSIFRLLKALPETLTNAGTGRNGKKRKFCHE